MVPVTPCRVVDTRLGSGPLGGPDMLAGTSRSFPIPTSSCSIPANAAAYSLNVTVVPSKTLRFLTIWPTGQTQPGVSTLNSYNGQVVANAAIVPAGTSGAVSVYVTDETEVIIDIDGYFALDGSDASTESTAFGTGALSGDLGLYNSAFGDAALAANRTGISNSAFGSSALFAATGSYNTGIGANALGAASGSFNTAVGWNSLGFFTTVAYNFAVGTLALFHLQTGGNNTAVGHESLMIRQLGLTMWSSETDRSMP